MFAFSNFSAFIRLVDYEYDMQMFRPICSCKHVLFTHMRVVCCPLFRDLSFNENS